MNNVKEFVHIQDEPGTQRGSASHALPAPVLVVEDESLSQLRLRDALLSLGYDDTAICFADSVSQADQLLATTVFAMALIDIGLPDGSGIDVIRRLHQRNLAIPILVVSMWNTAQTVVAALQAGAVGYVLKERDTGEMAQAIQSAVLGGAPIDPFVARHILEMVGPDPIEAGASSPASLQPQATPLSARELEILGLVSKGLTNHEIANVLKLSKLTIGCHIRNIYKKLDVNSRTQAVFEARSFGWLH